MRIEMTQVGQKPRAEYKGSPLLTPEENDCLRHVCSMKQYSVSTAGVAQVFKTVGPRHERWCKAHVGLVCFLRKPHMSVPYIAVFDFDKSDFVWMQELFLEFSYSTPLPYFHTFEADSCQAALNFASEDEARSFKECVERVLRRRQQRQAEKRAQQQNNVHVANRGGGGRPSATMDPQPVKSNSISTIFGGNSDRKLFKKKVDKRDIGLPSDFRHVQHLGLDVDIDEQLKKLDPMFFLKAGIDDSYLQSPENKQFIYDFVMEHNANLFSASNNNNKASVTGPPPPVPQRNDVPPGSRGMTHHRPQRPLPPTPNQTMSRGPAPPPPPDQVVAKPPAPAPGTAYRPAPTPVAHPPPMGGPAPPPPPVPAMGGGGNAPMPPPPPPMPPIGVGAPPPPPMPAMSGGGAPPPPAPPLNGGGGDTANSGGGGGGGMSALLSQIQEKRQLKHVDPDAAAAPKNDAPVDARDALLSQIRQGAKSMLKPVSERPQPPPGAKADIDGLASALQRAIQLRATAIQPNDTDSEEEEADDEEWDD